MARDGGAGVGAIVGIGLVLVATLVIGAFVARMIGGPASTTTAASEAPKPTVSDHGPPIPAVASSAPRPPLAFNDPENAPRFEHAKTTLEALTKTVGALSTAKDDAAFDDAKRVCAEADKEMVALGGEPHPTVKEVVETAHRLCDYQRPLSALDATIARIKAARKNGGKRPDALCKRAEQVAIEIHAGHYQDDPVMLRSLDELGKVCI
jgi:hypothetical protein